VTILTQWNSLQTFSILYVTFIYNTAFSYSCDQLVYKFGFFPFFFLEVSLKHSNKLLANTSKTVINGALDLIAAIMHVFIGAKLCVPQIMSTILALHSVNTTTHAICLYYGLFDMSL
jgi:hypothetical protein